MWAAERWLPESHWPPASPEVSGWHPHPWKRRQVRYWDAGLQMWTRVRKQTSSHTQASRTSAGDRSPKRPRARLLKRPLWKDWIVWLWLASIAIPAARNIAGYSGEQLTEYDLVSGSIDAAFYVGVQTILFLLVPSWIRRGLSDRHERQRANAPAQASGAPGYGVATTGKAAPAEAGASHGMSRQGWVPERPRPSVDKDAATGVHAVDLLERLSRLHAAGAITDEEWTAKRTELLGRI